MGDTLTAIVELQDALSGLNAAEALLAGIPDWMQELHEEHSREKAVIEEMRQQIEEARQERRQAEGEIGDLREKIKHFQEQIGLVRNQREYGALLHEIDTAKQQVGQLEELAIQAMEKSEELTGQLSQKEEAFQELDARHAAELEKWEGQKPDVARQAEQLRGRIEVLKERVPRRYLSVFQRTLDRYAGQALAPIQTVERGGKLGKIWHCGACNYRVRPQSVVAIQTLGSIEFCDSCKRILYLTEEDR